MEACGFARAGVPGEYFPYVVNVNRTTTQSSSTSYQETLSQIVEIETVGEVLTAVFSCNASEDVFGGTPVFRITADGVPYGYSANTGAVGGQPSMIHMVVPIEGLLPGPHTIAVDWKNASPSKIMPFLGGPPIYESNQCSLTCFRNRQSSDRETNGFPQRGWHMIYTNGTFLTKLASSNTSNVDTPTTLLLTQQFVSHHAQSCLLLRFTASAKSLDGGARRSNLYHVYVDGVFKEATGSETGAVGTGSNSNAALMAVIPVQAGNHKVEVYWAGSSVGSGSVVDPTDSICHAHLSIEEVFCEDVNTLSDMEGFATSGFSCRNIPSVRYSRRTTDVAGISLDVECCNQLIYVTGEHSALQVEFTASMMNDEGQSSVFRLYFDGVIYRGATTNGGAGGAGGLIQTAAITALYPVSPGNHRVIVTYRNIDNDELEAGSHPEYAHAHMLVREVALQADPVAI